jgi:hypothetical protein
MIKRQDILHRTQDIAAIKYNGGFAKMLDNSVFLLV